MFTKKESSHSGLKIIIVGCGKVGRNLAEQLSNEGHDITIVDKKAAMIQQMCNMYDVLGIEGNGAVSDRCIAGILQGSTCRSAACKAAWSHVQYGS